MGIDTASPHDAFTASLAINQATALLYRFYAEWDDIQAAPDRLLSLLDPAGFVLDLTLGQFATEAAVRGIWAQAQGMVAKASHHLTSVDVTVDADGRGCTANVQMIAQLVDHNGTMTAKAFTSALRCAPTAAGDWRVQAYKVREARSDPQPHTTRFDVVFQGGGAKGLVLVGAVRAIEEHGHTFGRLVGTSAGAVTATLLAAGFDADALARAVGAKLPDGRPRFSAFMDTPSDFPADVIENSALYGVLRSLDLPLISGTLEQRVDKLLFSELSKSRHFRTVFSLVERGGLYAGDDFLQWLGATLDARRAGLGSATLAEFATITGSDLTVVASDTSGAEILVLNRRTAPQCPIRWAVRMSMSIPFVWQEVVWRQEWGTYRGRDISGHTIVDGGVLSNFALDLLVTPSQDVLDVMGPVTGNEVLGLLIDEALAVTGAPPAKPAHAGLVGIELAHSRMVRRISRLIDTMTQAHDQFVMQGFEDRVCHLPAKGYGTTEFDMSDQRTAALIAAGHAAMDGFLATRRPPE